MRGRECPRLQGAVEDEEVGRRNEKQVVNNQTTESEDIGIEPQLPCH